MMSVGGGVAGTNAASVTIRCIQSAFFSAIISASEYRLSRVNNLTWWIRLSTQQKLFFFFFFFPFHHSNYLLKMLLT